MRRGSESITLDDIRPRRETGYRHVWRGNPQIPLVWVGEITENQHYYGKNCCPAWQPPIPDEAGIRNKYEWKALHHALDSSFPWHTYGIEDDNVGCRTELENVYAVQPEGPFDFETNPFHAINQTEFFYRDDGETDPIIGLDRVNVVGGNGRNIRFAIMSLGWFNPTLFTGCENEPRRARWAVFFNHYFFPFTEECG